MGSASITREPTATAVQTQSQVGSELPGHRDRYRPSREATELTVIATMTVPNTYDVRA